MNKQQRASPAFVAPILVHLLLLSAGLPGCASIERQVFTDEYAANPVPPDKVRTLSDQQSVANCRKVASLTATGEQPEEKMRQKLRKVAGKLGANTLWLVQTRHSTIKDVVEALPEAAAAGAMGIDAKPPPALTVEAIAYHCDESS